MLGSTLQRRTADPLGRVRVRRRLKSYSRRLSFEPLEDRRVLAAFTVSNLNDAPVNAAGSAPGTLRQAIYDANHAAGADSIQFAAGLQGEINLSVLDDAAVGGSSLLVTSQIKILGNANGITIKRGSSAAEMRLIRVTAAGDLTLDSLSFSGGVARGASGSAPGENGGEAHGGAILSEGTLRIVASTFYDNFAVGGDAGTGGRGGSGMGGAIYSDVATLSISNATFSGNAASSGSGVGVGGSFGGSVYARNGILTVRNSTFTNSTTSYGRSIYVLADNATATVEIQSSILGQSYQVFPIRDLLLAQEEGQFEVSGGNNLIRAQSDYQFLTVSTDDPLLGSLAKNGGPTMTHALLASSPAINLGNNTQNLVTDQRGASFSRVVGGVADIGALELQTVVGPSLAGDYNGNQRVDGADYVMWRKTRGATVVQYSGADGDGSSLIDSADYDVWRAHFGDVPPGAASVPNVSAELKSESVNAEVRGLFAAEIRSKIITGYHTAAKTYGVAPEAARRCDLAIVELLRLKPPESDTGESTSESSERAAELDWSVWLTGGGLSLGLRLDDVALPIQ